MTPSELRAWQWDMRYTQKAAAKALGVSPATYKRWIVATTVVVPRLVSLACAALRAGIEGYRQN